MPPINGAASRKPYRSGHAAGIEAPHASDQRHLGNALSDALSLTGWEGQHRLDPHHYLAAKGERPFRDRLRAREIDDEDEIIRTERGVVTEDE
jgi:hypothetical protein